MLTHLHSRWFICFPKLRFSDQRKTPQWQTGLCPNNTKEGYVTWLMSHSLLTFEQAESVFYFQMNGCLSINRLMLRNHCNDWKQIQTVIDKFIKAGLESFLIHDQREENASDNFCSKISPTVTASSTLR